MLVTIMKGMGVMRKNIIKKAGVSVLALIMTTGLLACNTKIRVQYDYDASQYVKLGQYKELEVSVDTEAIENELIQNRVLSDQKDNTYYTEVTREAQEGDQVTLDFTGSIGGAEISGFSDEDYSLILGTDSFVIDGFVDELYGMKSGDMKVVTLTVPDNFSSAPDYAGRKIVYEITMKKVEQPNVPMITDGYVKEKYNCDTVADYKAKIKSELQSDIDSQILSEKKEKVLELIYKNSEVTGYPEEYLQQKTEELNDSLNFYSVMKDMTNDEYCQENFGISFDEYVKKTVEQDAIMQLIVKEENLSITEYEYKDNLASFAADMGYSNKDSFVEKFGKNMIVKNMLYQKAQNLVVESATIK